MQAALLELRYGVPFQPVSPVPAPIPAAPTGHHLEIAEVKRLLPQRYPILLIDRVDATGEDGTLIATKTVTVNEPCYAGLPAEDCDHSYPAALLVESWCQGAGIVMARDRPDALTSRVILFGGIANLALTAPVGPGDVLRHRARALKILSDAAVFEGETLVGDVPVMTVGQVIIALRPASEVAARPVPS